MSTAKELSDIWAAGEFAPVQRFETGYLHDSHEVTFTLILTDGQRLSFWLPQAAAAHFAKALVGAQSMALEAAKNDRRKQ